MLHIFGTTGVLIVLALAILVARYPLRSLPPTLPCPLCTRPMGPVRHLQGGLFICILALYYLAYGIADLPPLDYASGDTWIYLTTRPELITALVFLFIGSREAVTPHMDYACKKCRATWHMRDGELLGTHDRVTGFYHFFPF